MKRIALFLSLVFALGLTACGKPERDPHTIVVARAGGVVSLDPAVTLNTGDLQIIGLLYERLTVLNTNALGGPRAEPGLATAWDMSADGMAWTFTLDPGAQFADGSPVTAEAVVFSINRIRALGRAGAQGLFWLNTVEAVDDHTVQFTLNFPFPPLPMLLALPNFGVINPAAENHAVDGDYGSAWLAENSAGSGPYVVETWERGQRIILSNNPVTAPEAYFTRAIYRVVPDSSARRIQLERGDVDILSDVGGEEARRLEGTDGVVVVNIPGPNTLSFLTLNTRRAALDDVRVREAIALAIDQQLIVDTVLAGNAEVPNGLLPRGVPGHDPALPVMSRDLPRARGLLAEAGYAEGISLSLTVGQVGPVSEAVVAQLGEAGFDVTLEVLSISALDARRANNDFDILYDGWTLDFPDPWIFMNLAFSSPEAGGIGNFSGFNSPELDGALFYASLEADPAARDAAYAELNRQVLAQWPIVPLFSPNATLALREGIEGLEYSPYFPGAFNLEDMSRAE